MSKKQRPELVYAARLDADGIYQGMDHLPKDQLTPLHLPQIQDCDLPAGHARWVPDKAAPYGGSFHYLRRTVTKEALTDANTVRAIACGFLALQAQGFKLPSETLAWLEKYTASFDFKG
jgi:hypothetical protein